MTSYTPTRPIMTRAELAERHYADHGRNYAASDDGYDDMDLATKRGWRVLSAWGRDGWDLGEWPYVTFAIKDATEDTAKGRYLLLTTCEGDHTYYGFDSNGDRDAAIDYLFLWYAAGSSWGERCDLPLTWEDRDKLDNGELEVEGKWRGPYRTEA